MKLIKGLRSLNRVAAGIVFVLGAGGARAVELGDSAPPIQISEWVKGGPISLAKGSNFYVLDFWATEGSNSRYTVPYVSNLQRTYRSKGVIMIGVTSEPASRIKKFLSGLESPVEYAQAVDLNGRTTASYLGTPGGLDLPHAFVIDREGRVVWHG